QRQQGLKEEALGNYRKVMGLKQVPVRGWIDVARLEMQVQLEREPARRNWAGAEQALDKAALAAGEGAEDDQAEQALEGALLRADLLAMQGKPREAEELLNKTRADKAYQKAAQQAQVWAALVRLALHARDRATALARLDEADRTLGFQIDLRVARIRFWAAS